MTIPQSLQDNEVFLGGYRLLTDGKMNITKATQFPGKVTIGNTQRSDQVLADEWVMDDWRGGLGVRYLDAQIHRDKWWYSFIDTLRNRQLILPQQITSISKPAGLPAGAAGNPELLIVFNNLIYASFNGVVYTWNGAAWSGAGGVHTVPGGLDCTEAIVHNGYLYITNGTNNASYVDTAGAWVDFTLAAGRVPKFFELFQVSSSSQLWAIDNTGELWHLTTSPNTWADTSSGTGGILLNETTTDLISYRDANDQPALYIATTTGLFSCDVYTKKIYRTALKIPENPHAGKNCVVWSDGNLYFPDSQALWRYPKVGQIVDVGLDRGEESQEGLAYHEAGEVSANGGDKLDLNRKIMQLTSHPNFIIATLYDPFDAISTSKIFGYNGQGWHFISDPINFGGSAKKAANSLLFTTAFANKRRLFYWNGSNVVYLTFPEGSYNPLDDSGYVYDIGSHEFLTPWFDGGYAEIDKLAVSMKFKTKNISANQIIDIQYAIDEATTYTSLGTLDNTTVDSTTKEATFYFPSTSNRAGVKFKTIRFYFRFSTTVNTTSPVIRFFDFRFKKMPNIVWSYTFRVLGTSPTAGATGLLDTWRTMKSLAESKTLNQFGYSTDDEGMTNRWVEVAGVSGVRHSGKNKESSFTVTVVELEPSS